MPSGAFPFISLDVQDNDMTTFCLSLRESMFPYRENYFIFTSFWLAEYRVNWSLILNWHCGANNTCAMLIACVAGGSGYPRVGPKRECKKPLRSRENSLAGEACEGTSPQKVSRVHPLPPATQAMLITNKIYRSNKLIIIFDDQEAPLIPVVFRKFLTYR